MIQRTTCHFAGQVQGVGFRYTVQRMAEDFAVRGYVRNLSDGRVELVMEGEGWDRRLFLEAVKDRMAENIDQVQVVESAATGEFSGFGIRR